MDDKMSGGNGWRFAIGLVLVVALILGAAAIGYAAYSAGIGQGAAMAAGAPGRVPGGGGGGGWPRKAGGGGGGGEGVPFLPPPSPFHPPFCPPWWGGRWGG